MWYQMLITLLASSITYAEISVCDEQFCRLNNGTTCDRAIDDCPPCLKLTKNITYCVDNSFLGKCIGTGGEKCQTLVLNTTVPPTTSTPFSTKSPNTTNAFKSTSVSPKATTESPSSADPNLASTQSPSVAIPDDSSSNVGVYIAIAIGAIVFIGIIAFIVIRRRRAEDDDEDDDEVQIQISPSQAKPYNNTALPESNRSPPPQTPSQNEIVERVLGNATVNELLNSDSENEEIEAPRRRNNDTNMSVEF